MELKEIQEEVAALRQDNTAVPLRQGNTAVQMELKAKWEEIATPRETSIAVQRESQKHDVDMSAMDLENRALQKQIATFNSPKQEEIECLQKQLQDHGPEWEIEHKKCCRVS